MDTTSCKRVLAAAASEMSVSLLSNLGIYGGETAEMRRIIRPFRVANNWKRVSKTSPRTGVERRTFRCDSADGEELRAVITTGGDGLSVVFSRPEATTRRKKVVRKKKVRRHRFDLDF